MERRMNKYIIFYSIKILTDHTESFSLRLFLLPQFIYSPSHISRGFSNPCKTTRPFQSLSSNVSQVLSQLLCQESSVEVLRSIVACCLIVSQCVTDPRDLGQMRFLGFLQCRPSSQSSSLFIIQSQGSLDFDLWWLKIFMSDSFS